MVSTINPKTFNLMRWFSIACWAAIFPVAAITGYVLSAFVTEETLQRDAALTAQFIQNVLRVEGRHAGLKPNVTIAELIDLRTDPTKFGVSPIVAAAGRGEFLDHLQSLPDTLLASVFARDGRIVWSTNQALIGTMATDNDELTEAFQSEIKVDRHYSSTIGVREEQRFVVAPKEFFIETYIPLFGAQGGVVAVAEIYKEPSSLVAVIQRGQQVVWAATVICGLLVYLFLFSIIRRGSALLEQQQKQLAEMDAMAYIGEMATAVAHSLRSPLASIRSSAELVLYTDSAPVHKNAQDIIKQVDFLSRWVREMLVFSRPVIGEHERVDIVAVMSDVLESFAVPITTAGVRVEWSPDGVVHPMVEGNVSLVTQALHSVLSNALEAMPKGGTVNIAMRSRPDHDRCDLMIRDTGIGMNEKQLATACKPFQTTKRHGLGVGLAMVKRVMERFGGSVVLSSQENQGTEVRLEFRLVRG